MQEKTKCLRKRRDTYFIDITINGRRIRKSTGETSLKKAQKVLCDFLSNKDILEEDIKDKKDNKLNSSDPIYTFDIIALKFLEEKIRVCRQSTIDYYKILLKNLFKFFSKRKLTDINKMLIKEYENYRLLNGCKQEILRKEFIVLNIILNLAVELDLIKVNPLNSYKFRTKLKDYEPKERFLTIKEIKKLLETDNKTLKRLMIFLLETGMRINETLNLLFTDIATDTNTNIQYVVIRKELSKNKKERFIPLSILAMEQVNKQKLEFPNSSFIFTVSKGNFYKTTPKTAMNTAFIKAGLKEKGDLFHILRHTFASLKLQGLDIYGNKIKPLRLEIISKLLGHSSIDLTLKVYAKFSKESLIKIL